MRDWRLTPEPESGHHPAQRASLLLLTTAHAAALRCYVSIDSPCEVFKGYKGGCVQDIGVAIECPSESSAACKTTFRY